MDNLEPISPIARFGAPPPNPEDMDTFLRFQKESMERIYGVKIGLPLFRELIIDVVKSKLAASLSARMKHLEPQYLIDCLSHIDKKIHQEKLLATTP